MLRKEFAVVLCGAMIFFRFELLGIFEILDEVSMQMELLRNLEIGLGSR